MEMTFDKKRRRPSVALNKPSEVSLVNVLGGLCETQMVANGVNWYIEFNLRRSCQDAVRTAPRRSSLYQAHAGGLELLDVPTDIGTHVMPSSTDPER